MRPEHELLIDSVLRGRHPELVLESALDEAPDPKVLAALRDAFKNPTKYTYKRMPLYVHDNCLVNQGTGEILYSPPGGLKPTEWAAINPYDLRDLKKR